MPHARVLWILALLLFSIGCGESAAVDNPAEGGQDASFTAEMPAADEGSAVTQTPDAASADTAPQADAPTAPTATITSPETGATPDLAATATVATRLELRERYAEYEIVTILPRDAILAIDDPEFLSVEAAKDWYEPDELVMGVVFDGEARAYSVPMLSRHEIVNDTVGGVKIAVTW